MTYPIQHNDPVFQRHDAAGTLANDFQYSYYAGTNRLRETGPFLEDMVYAGGRVLSNSKVYRRITVQGNSYIPAGDKVVLRATEKITLAPQFRAASGRRFRARIVRDEDMYQYDAIGNLIRDQAEGTKITWTPYGKVRSVSAQSDTVVTTFRYDGAGNRIEKRVVTNDTLVAITRYLRDAGGNIMAIYQDSTLQEQPIYGSSRLGQYQGGAVTN